jgi:hypothetical protein
VTSAGSTLPSGARLYGILDLGYVSEDNAWPLRENAKKRRSAAAIARQGQVLKKCARWHATWHRSVARIKFRLS